MALLVSPVWLTRSCLRPPPSPSVVQKKHRTAPAGTFRKCHRPSWTAACGSSSDYLARWIHIEMHPKAPLHRLRIEPKEVNVATLARHDRARLLTPLRSPSHLGGLRPSSLLDAENKAALGSRGAQGRCGSVCPLEG